MTQSAEPEIGHPCPKCGSETEWSPECPGWNDNGKIMVCYPICGNADRWDCTDDDCDWWFQDPIQRKSQREMGERPTWRTGINDDRFKMGEPS